MLFHGSVSLLLVTYSHAVSTKDCPIAVTENRPLFDVLGQREAAASSLCIALSQNINVFVVLDDFTPSRNIPWGSCACLWLCICFFGHTF